MFKKAYSGGTFDMLHVGHLELLEYCKEIASEVVISLNTDDFIIRYKGKTPVIPYTHRKEMLLATRYVDAVVPNYSGEDSKPTILEVSPDVIVIGMDWLERDYCKQMSFDASWLNKNKIALCYVPRTRNVSSTDIKSHILSN